MKHLAFPLVLLFAGLGLVGSGCSKRSRAEHHLKYADRYFEVGQQDQAEMEYVAVLQNDSQNSRALRNLGFIHLRQGRYDTALQLLTAARSLLPDDLEVRLKYAELLATLRAFPEARAELLQVLQRTPENGAAAILLADLAGTNQLAEVRQVLQGCRQQAGERAAFHVALGTLAAKAGDWTQADQEYRLGLSDPSVQGPAHLGLANLCLARHDLTNAADHLERMAAAEPVDSPRRLHLVDFKLGTGASEEARRLLTEMTFKAPRFLLPWQYLARLAFAEGRYGDCKAALKKVLVRSPTNLEARLLGARMNLALGQPNEAIKDLDALVTLYPRHPGVRHQLGRAYLQLNQVGKALEAFDQALSLDPGDVETILAVAGVHLRQGDLAQVVTLLTGLLKTAPGVIPAHLLLAEAYRLRGTPEDALGVYRSLAANLPQDPRFSLRAGSLLQSLGREAEARQAFGRVLEIAPGHLEALAHLAELDMAAGQPAAALRRVREQAEKFTNSLPHQLLLAELYLEQKQFEAATTLLLRLPQTEPGTGVAALLARVYAQANQHDQALSKLESALVNNPKDGALLMQKALILAEIRQYAKARDVYERLLGINPQDARALNNLAYLYCEQLGRLDKAAQLARKARELNPLDPSIADTLGWILFKQREYPSALSLLVETQEALSSDPEAQYHLGLAHYMMGAETLAKSALVRALQSPKAFGGREQAKRWLEMIELEQTAAGVPVPLPGIALALTHEPTCVPALMAQGLAQERQPALASALQAYEAILKQWPGCFPAMRRLAVVYAATGDDPRALKMATRVREADPKDLEIAKILGKLAYRGADYGRAASLFKEVSASRPLEAEAWFYLGLAQAYLKAVPEAQSALERGLSLDPKHALAEQARRALAGMK